MAPNDDDVHLARAINTNQEPPEPGGAGMTHERVGPARQACRHLGRGGLQDGTDRVDASMKSPQALRREMPVDGSRGAPGGQELPPRDQAVLSRRDRGRAIADPKRAVGRRIGGGVGLGVRRSRRHAIRMAAQVGRFHGEIGQG
jgi:hypothetical protein